MHSKGYVIDVRSELNVMNSLSQLLLRCMTLSVLLSEVTWPIQPKTGS